MPIVRNAEALTDENLSRVFSYSVDEYNIEIDGEFIKDAADKQKKTEPLLFKFDCCSNKYGFSLRIVDEKVVLTASVYSAKSDFTVGAEGGEDARRQATKLLKDALIAKGVKIVEDGKDSVVSFSREQLKTNDFLKTTPMGEVDIFLDKIKKDAAARDKFAQDILAIASNLDQHIDKHKDIDRIKAYRKQKFESGDGKEGTRKPSNGYENSVYTYPKQNDGDEGYPEGVIKRKRVKIPDSPFWVSIGVVNGEFIIAAQEDRMYFGINSRQMGDLKETLEQNEVFGKVFEAAKTPGSDMVYGGPGIYFAQNAFPLLKSEEQHKPMPPKTEDRRRSLRDAPLSAAEELAVQCRVNPGYEYTSEDINLIMRARNIEQGIGEVWTPEAGVTPGEDERARFSGILFHKENRDIVDETEIHSSVPSESFVRNERGGFVVQWPSMALTGAEANSGHTYICESLRDIMAFARDNHELNPYPLKILFPYNPSRGHWVAGEIILEFDGNGDLVVQLSQYNPMSNFSAPLDRNFQQIFLENYRWAIGDTDNRAKITIVPTKIEQIGRKENGRSVAIQRGGLSCGVFATYALDKLKTKVPPSKMWDDFPYDGSGAERQRRADVAGVHGMLTRGVISNDTFSRDFGPSRLVMRQDWVSEVEFLRRTKESFREYLSKVDRFEYDLHISPKTIEEIDRYETLSRKKIWPRIFQDKGILRLLAEGQHPEILDIFIKKLSTEEKQYILQRVLVGDNDTETVAALMSQLESESRPSSPRDVAASPAKRTLRRRDAKSVMQGILSDTTTPESDDPLRFNKSLAALDLEIQKNIADKETLDALLFSILSSGESEIVKQAMAERLIVAGATVAETALPDGPSDQGLAYTLCNEYYLSLLQTATLDGILAFRAKYTNLDLAYTSIKDGMSALHYAVQNADDKVWQYLLTQEGIEIDAVDHYGRTPLILATMQGNYAAVEALVEKDANVRLRDAAYKMSADQWAQAMVDIEPDGQREKYERILEFLQAQVEKPRIAPFTSAEKGQAEAILYAIFKYCDAVHNHQIKSVIPFETVQMVGLLASDALNFVYNGGVINEDTDELQEYGVVLARIATGLAKMTQPEEFLATDEDERVDALLISGLVLQIADSQGYPTTKTAEEEFAETEAPETPGEEVLEEAVPPRAIERRKLPPKPPKKSKKSTIPEMPSLVMGKERARKDINHSADRSYYHVEMAADPAWLAAAQRIKAEALEQKEKIERGAAIVNPDSKKFKDNHPKFSLNRSDFFSEARKITEIDGKKVKAANLPYVLITPEELSFVACDDYGDVHLMETATIPPVSQDEKTYVKLSGTYQDILQPDKITNPSKAFQPYYANFGGMIFQEQGGGNKIFGKACLFAANFRNCVFDNVDLSQIPPDIFATIEFNQCNFIEVDFSQFSVATLACMGLFDRKFDNCAFNGCKFPDGVSVESGFFKLDAGKSAAAAHIADSYGRIEQDLGVIREKMEVLRRDEKTMTFEDREREIAELRKMIEGVTVFAQVVKVEAQNKEPGARPSSRDGGVVKARPISREGDSGVTSPALS